MGSWGHEGGLEAQTREAVSQLSSPLPLELRVPWPEDLRVTCQFAILGASSSALGPPALPPFFLPFPPSSLFFFPTNLFNCVDTSVVFALLSKLQF